MTNKSESIVPMFKANVTEKGLDGVRILKGVNYKICQTEGNRWQGCDNWSLNFVDIDINTLQISLDNGINWATMEDVREALIMRKYLEEENNKLKMMITHGLGWEDMKNDITYPSGD